MSSEKYSFLENKFRRWYSYSRFVWTAFVWFCYHQEYFCWLNLKCFLVKKELLLITYFNVNNIRKMHSRHRRTHSVSGRNPFQSMIYRDAHANMTPSDAAMLGIDYSQINDDAIMSPTIDIIELSDSTECPNVAPPQWVCS